MKNSKKKKSKQLKKPLITDIVLQRKRSYVIDTRCRADGETYVLSQRLMNLGFEVHSVLNRSRVIFGRCTDEVRDLIKLESLVKHIEIDE